MSAPAVPIRPAGPVAQSGHGPARRRLAAVMFGDVVGYSRLVGAEESWTLATLAAARRLIAERVTAAGGRVVSTPGDAVLAEFPSAVDAVRCAVIVQRRLAERLPASPRGSRLDFRFGLNVGDLVVQDDDIMGDGVNIAARLQAVAEAGGVIISGTVYDQVRDKLDLVCMDLGEQPLKNIRYPVRLYRVDMTPGALLDRGADDMAPSSAPSTLVLPDRPTIAVLPFVNLSRDPQRDYLADGITEGLVNALAHSHWFFVIAHNSTLAYRGRPVDLRVVGRELGARYLVEGSVQFDGERVRTSTQLSDASTGFLVWSDQHDCTLQDCFGIQDAIVQQLAASIEPRLLLAEGDRSIRDRRADPDAHDWVMRAYAQLWRMDRVAADEARGHLRRAAEIDPGYAQAHMGLAMANVLAVYMGWTAGMDQALEEAEREARLAISLDAGDAWGHLALGFVCLQTRRLDEAIAGLRRALDLNPSFAMAYGCLAQALIFAGEPAEAAPLLRTAMRISPRDPFMVYWEVAMAMVHFMEARYDDGADWARRAVRERGWWPGGHRLLAICLALGGKMAEARQALEQMLKLQPEFSRVYLQHLLPFRRPEDFDRYVAGLRAAGWTG